MRILLAFFLTLPAWANIPAGAVWTIRSTATASNVNGAVFNTGATFALTDGSMTGATGNSPVLSSGLYTFVAGDVGHWIYTVSNTGGEIVRGRWKITSVNAGAATLDASIGAATYHNATTRTWTVNSLVAGLASVASPTSITFGIDYSESNAALCAITDLVIDGTTATNVTSSGCPFGRNHVGNGLKIASGTGFTVDWFWIQSISGSTATLDASAGTLSSTGGVAKLGGAASLGSASGATDDLLLEKGIGGNDWFVENATYTIGGTVTISAAGGSQAPIRIIGYASLRGDNPTGSTRPILNPAGNTFTFAANWDLYNIQGTGSAATAFSMGSGSKILYSKFTNTSTTTARTAIQASADSLVAFCELISYRGYAINLGGSGAILIGNYIHDSDVGIRNNVAANTAQIQNNIIAGNATAGIQISTAVTAQVSIINNTIYGAENKLGTCISFATGATDMRVMNNIIAGCATGVSHADAQTIGVDMFNAYYNNTADTSNWALGKGSITGTNPSFTNVTQLTGTGASSTTNTITAGSGTPFTDVVDNVDFVTISAGSGTGFVTTSPPTKLLITAHSPTSITVSSNLTTSGSGSGITWGITQGHNYAIGTALKALGSPGAFPAGLTTGYMDIGAAQRQEAGGGGGTRIY